MDQRLLPWSLVASKLVLVIGVQSVLVLALGGVAVGVSLSRGAHAEPVTKQKKKKVARAVVAHDAPEETEPAAEEPDASSAPERPHAKTEEPVHADRPGHPEKPAHAEEAAHAEKPEELHPIVAPGPSTPAEIFAWLDEGNGRWAQGVTRPRDVLAFREKTAKAWAPQALVLTCADGRAEPDVLFDTGPGSLVTLRGAVLRGDASVLTGVETLLRRHGVKVVVVLGHEGCDDGSGRSVEAIVSAATGKLFSRPMIQKRIKANELLVLRARYELDSGTVRWLDSEEPRAAAPSGPSGHH